ncbi:hypothetical protein [Actinoplanes sp. NPDC026623]|uniref:hypothetical protein n=1 Tax=Actinoplanes sp. NPDC026623 TaxID=3155610 RepID=UPI0033D6831E
MRFLAGPSVWVSSRLMCTRLVLDGRSPRSRHYSAALGAQAWAAAEVVFAGGGPDDDGEQSDGSRDLHREAQAIP